MVGTAPPDPVDAIGRAHSTDPANRIGNRQLNV